MEHSTIYDYAEVLGEATCHMTKYCYLIGAGIRLVYAVHQTLPSLAEVGLACETNKGLVLKGLINLSGSSSIFNPRVQCARNKL